MDEDAQREGRASTFLVAPDITLELEHSYAGASRAKASISRSVRWRSLRWRVSWGSLSRLLQGKRQESLDQPLLVRGEEEDEGDKAKGGGEERIRLSLLFHQGMTRTEAEGMGSEKQGRVARKEVETLTLEVAHGRRRRRRRRWCRGGGGDRRGGGNEREGPHVSRTRGFEETSDYVFSILTYIVVSPSSINIISADILSVAIY